MTPRGKQKLNAVELRRRAEAALARILPPTVPLGQAETDRLLHELQVHQIELELQNEELRDARHSSEKLLDRYTDLYDFAPVGYLTVSPTGKIVQSNLLGAKLLGLARKELLNKSLSTRLDPEFQSVVRDCLKALFGSNTAIRCEVTRAESGHGPTHLLLEGKRSVEETDCHLVLVDITARAKAAEMERLQSSALNAAADAIRITDAEGVIRWVNASYLDQSGLLQSEAIGQLATSVEQPVEEEAAQRQAVTDAGLHGTTWRGIATARHKDGSTFAQHRAVTPVIDANGHISHFITIGRDLTRELELEAELQQARKMDTVGRLAGGVAHDFNNLLTVINGSASLAIADLEPAHPLRESLQAILEAGERAAELTHHLLAFSRKQMMHFELIDLVGFIAGIHGMVQRLIGERVRLVLADPESHAAVRVDRTQLQQIVMNLAVNSRDAMPNGGTLTFSVSEVTVSDADENEFPGAPPGRFVVLAAMDTGTGMTPAVAARIFEPFFTTKPVGEGTGLGLSAVYGIIRQSAGFLSVQSTVGVGTTVRIALPAADLVVVDPLTGPSADAAGGTESILIVEDEFAVRALAERILRAAGYRVLSAQNGVEALELLESHQGSLDLIFTDMIMPEMGGRELAIRALARRPFLKVLFCSGYTEDPDLPMSGRTRNSAFLPKPYTAAQLRRGVRDLLDPETATLLDQTPKS